MFYLAPDSLADGKALLQHGWPSGSGWFKREA